MEELKELLNQIGLPTWAIPVVLILTAFLLFFAKSYYNRREARAEKDYEVLRKYAALQEQALIQAFRMLFEEVNLKALTQTEFERVVSQADDLILKPFTEYRAYLDSKVISKFYDIHNVLAQFKSDPTFQHKPSQDAIENLLGYSDRFLKDSTALKELILKRT